MRSVLITRRSMRVFISLVSIVELKLCGVGTIFQTVNARSYRCDFNCGTKTMRGLLSFPGGNREILEILYHLGS